MQEVSFGLELRKIDRELCFVIVTRLKNTEHQKAKSGEFSVSSSLILVEDLKVLDHICFLDDDHHEYDDKGVEDEQ